MDDLAGNLHSQGIIMKELLLIILVVLSGCSLLTANLQVIEGDKFTNSLGMQFVYILPGTFMMGSPVDEKGRQGDETQHKVILTDGFYMQATEVTVGQWRRFVQDTGFKTEAERDGRAIVLIRENWEEKAVYYWDNPGFRQTDDHPVTCVSWNDVQVFIRWLNMKGKERYRLPSEAEWEYACRAGTKTACFWGDNPDDACMYANVHDLSSERVNKFRRTPHDCDDGSAVMASVRSFRPNPFGLYDMLGNIYEWCQDRAEWKFKKMTDTYLDGIVDPLSTNGSLRIIRGGSWDSGRRGVRCAARVRHPPEIRAVYLGFRLILKK